MFWFELTLVLAAVAVAAGRIRIVSERQRAVVYRLGRPTRIVGPGLVLTIPFVDRMDRVDLDEVLPEWGSLSSEEIATRLLERAGFKA